MDPRENRLTEVTAAVLEQVDGLARVFIEHLLGAGVEDDEGRDLSESETSRRAELNELAQAFLPRVQVSTQVATNQGRFVDLELLLRPAVGAPGRGLLVWVEVKHGADLHGNQLDVYLQDIGRRPVRDPVDRVVVVLAPRGWSPTTAVVPPEVLRADWQGVGRTVKNATPGPRPAEQDWLLSEYIRYLKEEGLSDPDALTTISALSLMEFHAASRAAAGICKHADAIVQAEWGVRGEHQKTRGIPPLPAFGKDYWANYDPHRKGAVANPTWRGAWFEWGLRDTQYLEGARGSWAFMAGVTLVTKDNPTKVNENMKWFARRVADGFKYTSMAGYARLLLLRYPDELLRETTLEDQGRELGDWVVTAFGSLADNPPPM